MHPVRVKLEGATSAPYYVDAPYVAPAAAREEEGIRRDEEQMRPDEAGSSVALAAPNTGNDSYSGQFDDYHQDQDEESENGEDDGDGDGDDGVDFYPLPSKQAAKTLFPSGCPVLCVIQRGATTTDSVTSHEPSIICNTGTILEVGIDFASEDRKNLYKFQSRDCSEEPQILVETDMQFAPRALVTVKLTDSTGRTNKVPGVILGSEHYIYGGGPLSYTVQVISQVAGGKNVEMYRGIPGQDIRYRPKEGGSTSQRGRTSQQPAVPAKREPVHTQQVQTRVPPVASLQIPSPNETALSEVLTEYNDTKRTVTSNDHRKMAARDDFHPEPVLSMPETTQVPDDSTGESYELCHPIGESNEQSKKDQKKLARKSIPIATAVTPSSHSSPIASTAGNTAPVILGDSTVSLATTMELLQSSPNGSPSATLSGAENHQLNPFFSILRSDSHRIATAIKKLPKHHLPKISQVCFNFHLVGFCKNGPTCRLVNSHQDLGSDRANRLEHLLWPVMGPSGPIVTGAIMNLQQAPFRRIVRSDRHKIMTALKKLGNRAKKSGLKNSCLEYHLCGYCVKKERCKWAHTALTQKQAYAMEDALSSVTSPRGPIRCCPPEPDIVLSSAMGNQQLETSKASPKDLAQVINAATVSDQLNQNGEVVNPHPHHFSRVHRTEKHRLHKALQALRRHVAKAQLSEAHRKEGPLGLEVLERCLRWHLKGTCTITCRRSTDHTEMTAEDASELEVALSPVASPRGPIFAISRKQLSAITMKEERRLKREREALVEDSRKKFCKTDPKNGNLPPDGPLRLYLPGLSFDVGFFQELVKTRMKTPKHIGASTLRLGGKLFEARRYSSDNAASSFESMDEKCFFLKATGLHNYLPVNYMEKLEKHMIFAMDTELRGYLQICLAVLNDNYHHKTKEGILYAPYPRSFDKLEDRWDYRHMTVVQAGPKPMIMESRLTVSLELANECRASLQQNFPTCHMIVVGSSLTYPKIKPFVFISSRKYDDVYGCRRELVKKAAY